MQVWRYRLSFFCSKLIFVRQKDWDCCCYHIISLPVITRDCRLLFTACRYRPGCPRY